DGTSSASTTTAAAATNTPSVAGKGKTDHPETEEEHAAEVELDRILRQAPGKSPSRAVERRDILLTLISRAKWSSSPRRTARTLSGQRACCWISTRWSRRRTWWSWTRTRWARLCRHDWRV